MKKEERHQMKRDELATVLERVLVYAEDHLRSLIVIGAAIVIALLGGLLLRNWLQTQAAEASLRVGEMIATYGRPIIRSIEDLENNAGQDHARLLR